MVALALPHDGGHAFAGANASFAPQQPPGMRAGLVLAVIAHLLLIAALAWSVRWHASEPEGVTAELWSATPQIAAQRMAAPEPRPPPPAPPPAPQPRVEPRPQPAPPVPRAAEPPPDTRADAQIAVERAAAAKARRLDDERQEAARKAELAKRQAKLEEAQREKADRRRQQFAEAERQKQDQKQDQKKELEKARQDEKRLADIREANLKRMRAQAGSSDEASPSTTGTAARNAGPSASYAGRIKARIKPNIVLTSSVSGNPLATVEVRCAPDGTIVGRKLTKSSGSPAWDEAVLRAIDKTEVLPRDTDGRVPSSFSIDFKPSE